MSLPVVERPRSRRQVRAPEMATLGVAAILLASSWSIANVPGERDALRLTATLLTAFCVVWYHVLPQDWLAEQRFMLGGSAVQLIAAQLVTATGGVASEYFPYFLLTPLSAVFSYRPGAAAATGVVAIASFAAIWWTQPGSGVAPTRFVALLATVLLALLITRTMARRRSALAARTEELASAMERITDLAITDSLTGLYVRRFLDEQLRIAEPLVARSTVPYSLLAIDLDGLKAINDSEGHAAGDAALLRATDVLRATIRGSDIAARCGGDEFVVLLPQTDEGQAVALAERIRESTRVPGEGRPKVSLSIGVAEWRPGRSAAQILADADRALYAAKRAGRDRVAVA